MKSIIKSFSEHGTFVQPETLIYILSKDNPEEMYDPRRALELVKESSYADFDETIEVHLRMGLDPRQADQQLRDVVVLPHGLGKTVRVLVFAQGEGAKEAEKRGSIPLVA